MDQRAVIAIANVRKLLPYLRYLPTILLVIHAAVQIVEFVSDEDKSAEKQAAALATVQGALGKMGIVIDAETVKFLIDAVVAVNNSLGKFKK